LDQLLQYSNQIRKRAAYHIKRSQQQQKQQYDKNVGYDTYKVGDLLWQTNINLATVPTRKFIPRYVGPCVIKAINDLTYTVKDEAGRLFNVHYNRLKPYHVRQLSMNGSLSSDTQSPSKQDTQTTTRS
jgi:hypothetical protein